MEPEVLSAPPDLIGRVRQLKFWLQELNRIEARIENEEYLQNVLISLGTTPSDKCKFELRKLRKQRDRAKGKVAQLKYKEQ